VAWSLITILFLAPLGTLAAGAGVLAVSDNRRATVVEPVFMTVERTEFFDSQSVSVELSWSDGVTLKAPPWTGLVTETGVKPGEVVRAGSRVARVDGVWRVAAPTPTPFYAPVTSSSPASEVASLNALLRAMGFDSPDHTWTWRTSAALREFAHSIGITDAIAVTAMDPSWLIWSPVPEIVVASLSLTVGSPAPAQGEPVVTGPPRLRSVTVAPQEGASLPEVDAADEWVLRFEGVEMPYRAPETTEGLAGSAVEGALARQKPSEAEGAVERAAPIEGWRVPVSAVHTDAVGVQCVFRRSPTDRVVEPVLVVVQRGVIGTARIDGPLRQKDEILVNPSTFAGDGTCD
jgi:hypothetical protein